MEELLAQLRSLEAKILSHNAPIKRKYINLKDVDIVEREKYKPLDYNKRYFLITLTFDPKISNQLDEYGQKRRLLEVVDSLNSYNYYSCLEKHKSGVLHAHIMVQHDSIHDLEEILYKNRKLITNSNKLMPSINTKPVKQTINDIQRSYDYIWDHKKDHPEYKYIKINI